MKRATNIIGIACFMGLSLMGCGPTASEKRAIAMQDSIRTADSIAAEEAAAKAARIEAARQDSLAKVADFQSKIPTFRRLYGSGDFGKYLRNMGYAVKKKGKINYDAFDGSEEVTTYTLRLDKNHYCTIEEGYGYEWGWVKVKVVGAPDQLQRLKNEAKAERSKPDFEWSGANPWIDISGNEVSWGDGA